MCNIARQSEKFPNILFPKNTHIDEGLVEAVEDQVPDEPAVDEGGNEPEAEVRHHQKWSAAQYPVGGGKENENIG